MAHTETNTLNRRSRRVLAATAAIALVFIAAGELLFDRIA